MRGRTFTIIALAAAIIAGLAAVMAGLAPAAAAASFDCSRARSYAEKQICATPELSFADEKLAELYHEAKLLTANSEDFRAFVMDSWKRRELCEDVDCINGWFVRAFYDYNHVINQSVPDGEKIFLRGVRHFSMLDLTQDSENRGLRLETGQGAKRTFNMYFNQVAMFLDFVDEEGSRVALGYIFEGKETEEARYYAMGQHDFDGDGVDELICAATTDKQDADEAFAIYVYRVSDGQHWLLSAGSPVMPVIEVRAERIRVPRLHGTFLEWSFQDDEFRETGD